MTTKEKILLYTLPVLAVVSSIGVGFAGVTSAQSASGTTAQVQERGMHGERPVAMGKVSAISGTSITIQDQKPGETSGTEYSIDASNAKILKGSKGAAPTETTISSITVGDMIVVRGTVNGTAVTATEIMTGTFMHGRGGPGRGHGMQGTVSAVSGNTITLTGADGKSYTVDAATAQIGKVTSISVSDIQVGDTLNVMGAVSGTSITAKHIMDGVPAHPQQ